MSCSVAVLELLPVDVEIIDLFEQFVFDVFVSRECWNSDAVAVMLGDEAGHMDFEIGGSGAVGHDAERGELFVEGVHDDV